MGVEDNVGAEMLALMTRKDESVIDRIAASEDGRATLDIIYQAIITGNVSEFERKQANKALFAKIRRLDPDVYDRRTRKSWRYRVPIFPVKFMRVTPGHDYAPPEASLTPEGKVLVKYPVRVKYMSTFQADIATLPDVFTGAGSTIPTRSLAPGTTRKTVAEKSRFCWPRR